MSTINEINPKIDQTVQIFDQFYNYSANVPAMEYDIVLSYFRSVFTTTLAAENFTTALFRVAEESDTSAFRATWRPTLQPSRAKTAVIVLFT